MSAAAIVSARKVGAPGAELAGCPGTFTHPLLAGEAER